LNESHCVFKNYDDIVTLCPIENSVCILNNNEIKGPIKLTQGKINSTNFKLLHFRFFYDWIASGDILVLGTNVFRFNHPRESAKLKEKNVFKTGLL
jgi:kinesin family protein 16B